MRRPCIGVIICPLEPIDWFTCKTVNHKNKHERKKIKFKPGLRQDNVLFKVVMLVDMYNATKQAYKKVAQLTV